MKTIQTPIDTISKLAGEQRIKAAKKYRRSSLCMEAECPDGLLLYHSLSGELLLLNANECERWVENEALREKLIKRWFLVPMEHDEMLQCNQILNIASLMRLQKKYVNNYIIFTTTDCNARCFYCFEHGQRRVSMREETAHDVADYMLAHAKGKKITIRWFGGEPLFNARVIDVITQELRDHGADYEATMVSNANLFDAEAVEKAKTLWNLRHVLITIDGTEEVYNRTKAFIYKDGSVYQRVLSKIDGILGAGITVTVNLSMDAHNAENQYELADELGQRYSGRENFNARAGLLIEYVGQIRHFESDRAALEMVEALNAKLAGYGIREKRTLKPSLTLNSCMADSENSATILPDGRIDRCEHFGDSEEVGSIYGSVWDAEKVRAWYERRGVEEACKSCVCYPQCIRLKKCNASPVTYNPLFRGQKEQDLRERMRNSYEKWKQDSAKNTGGN